MNDSIDSIVEDCSLPPAVYMQRFHEDMDESEMVERMCRDLIGRTIAQMGRDGNIGRAYSSVTGTWFHHGDTVRCNGRVGTVIGTAVYRGTKHLVVVISRGVFSFELFPVDKAEKVDVPTLDDLIAALDSDLPYEKKVDMVNAYMWRR